MILMVDNYDSFTYNIFQHLSEIGAEVLVKRNDEISVTEIANLNPSHVVISPGPGNPDQAGISIETIQYFAGRLPLLGVCLGHQSLAQAYGAKVVRANRLMHGKTSAIHHHETHVFRNLPNPFDATRYHSLLVEKSSLPDDFEITAWTDEDEIMGLRHKPSGAEGVQFHPESILTTWGKDLLKNFTKCA